MTVYTYSRIPALNPNTSPMSVAKSASGSVYDINDTGFLTPLNMTLVATNAVVTTIASDANGIFPDFTLLDRTSCVFKAATGLPFVLTTTTPVPGPAGAPGPNTVPTQAAIQSEVTTPGTPTAGALNATYVPALAATSGIVYDPTTGNITSITEGGITTTFTYNADGTVNTETRLGKVRTWTYDANGNPTSSTVV